MACSTRARRSGLTRGEPLTTRDTVARETPASAATCSSVGCAAGPALCGTVTSFLPGRASSAGPAGWGASPPRLAVASRTLALAAHRRFLSPRARPSRALASLCLNWRAALPDHLRVPERAVLGGALLGGEVDVDQAEPLRVSPGPLEVVHQRPGKIAAQRDARGDRGVAGAQVGVDVAGALAVVDEAVRGELVAEGGAVLGDQQWHGRVALGDAAQHLDQPGLVDLPAHPGDRPPGADEADVLAGRPGRLRRQRRGPVDAGLAWQARHGVAAVVVDPQQVDRGGDDLEVALVDVPEVAVDGEVGDHVFRVAALEQRVEEQPVLQPVDAPGGVEVLLGVAGRGHSVQV